MKAKLIFLSALIALNACKKETTDPGTNPPPNTDAREKFVAAYNLHSQCMVNGSGSEMDYVLTIEKGTAPNAVILKNFIGDNYTVNATVTNSDITIPAQDEEFHGDPVTISGSGKLNGSTLSYNWTMVAKSGQWSATCTDSGAKK
jgi:hypothetical protein